MDIISAVLRAVAEHLGPETFTEAVAQQIEQQIKFQYGGKVYRVSPYTEAENINRLREQSRRNLALKRAVEEGVSPGELSTAVGLSRQQIHRLTKKGW